MQAAADICDGGWKTISAKSDAPDHAERALL